jgi:hypothetical protein
VTAASNTTPTAAALDRLGKIEPAPSFGHGNELEPWLKAASVSGFELPPDVLDVIDVAAHWAEEQVANTPPKPHIVGDVKAILAGASVVSIIDADAAHAAAVARYDTRAALLLAASRRLQGMVAAGFAPTRDGLIRVELRQAVADVLAEAAKAAKSLRKFAPAYSEAALLASGSPAELAVWRGSRQLQANFATLVAAWRASWSRATAHGTGTIDRAYLPMRPGGFFSWVAPDDVQDERLRLGHDSEILRIATAPSEFRLAAPSEIVALVEKMTADLPQDSPRPAWMIVRSGVCVSVS